MASQPTGNEDTGIAHAHDDHPRTSATVRLFHCALPCEASSFGSVEGVLSELQCGADEGVSSFRVENPDGVQPGACVRTSMLGTNGLQFAMEQLVAELSPPLPAAVMSQYYADLPRCSAECALQNASGGARV